jgi:DNA-directed RNA polymerase subunit omega
MLKPTDIENLKGNKSRYAIVVGVAKRARDIAANAEEQKIKLLDKPVSMAIKDITEGGYKIMMPTETDDEEA